MTKTHEDHARKMEAAMKLYLFPGYTAFRSRMISETEIATTDVILDFGCGVGLLEDFIVPRLKGASGCVVGVDIGRELIGIARSRFLANDRCEFSVIDQSGELPFAECSFDLIVTSLVFHLLTQKQKETVLKEFRRILKPGGRVVMAEIGQPTALYGRWIKFLTLRYWSRIWPYVINSKESFEGRLPGVIRRAGFGTVRTIVKLRGYIDLLRCSV
ncbi:MAG TPA: class I SAM-dependent methyltransferase [Bacteroidota bacterium]|nr:class I SAM-dependent methyltransferase [Bacteroidota bacterium]